MQFAAQWQIPLDGSNRDRRIRRQLLNLDPTGALLNMPLDIFGHVYCQRYGDPYAKRGIDYMNDREIEERIKYDLSLKAELETFDERFVEFQAFMRHIQIMHILNRQSEIIRFDIFDLDSYEKITKRLDDLIRIHKVPGL